MRFKAFCASLVTMIVLAGSAWAHHSPSAIFDMKKKVNITGTLTRSQLGEPAYRHHDGRKEGRGHRSVEVRKQSAAWFARWA